MPLTSYVVASDEGPQRRYYGITDHGRATLEQARATWAEFSDLLGSLLTSTNGKSR